MQAKAALLMPQSKPSARENRLQKREKTLNNFTQRLKGRA